MSNNDAYIRQNILRWIVISIFIVFACRTGYMQLIDRQYKRKAANNVLRFEVQYAPRGEVVERLGWDERGVLTADVEIRTEETFYVCYGDWIGRISMLLTLLGMLYYSAYRIRKKNHLVD